MPTKSPYIDKNALKLNYKMEKIEYKYDELFSPNLIFSPGDNFSAAERDFTAGFFFQHCRAGYREKA